MRNQERECVISDWWRLTDKLSVHDAALLIVGVDPNSEEGSNCQKKKPYEQPHGYGAVVRGISAAIGKKIDGTHIPFYETDINGNRMDPVEGTINTDESTVNVESLVAWLRSFGIKDGFFLPRHAIESGPAYLDKNHPRYAPKLAAAVNAWLATENKGGQTAKKAIDKWLRMNASQYGLIKEDGNPNESAIEELSKVANWELKGGAPKTPGV